MKVCAGICRKATLQLPDADYLSSQCQSQSSRAQNRDFCALLPARTLAFRRFEHKIEVFVRFWGPEPSFSGFSSTKSRFLCFFGLWNPRFLAFRAQNRGFCALLAAGPSFSGVSLLLEEHFRVMEQFDSTFVVAHVLRIYDTAYCLKLHCGVCGH